MTDQYNIIIFNSNDDNHHQYWLRFVSEILIKFSQKQMYFSPTNHQETIDFTNVGGKPRLLFINENIAAIL